VNYEQLLRAVFSYFHSQRLKFFFFYIVGSALKELLDTKVKMFKKKFVKYFLGLKTGFLRASCFGFYSKGCLSATPSFSVLDYELFLSSFFSTFHRQLKS
jgi:hypothetical protein